ncbi:MAG: DUF2520 domain-containing protein [Chloroflexi bacterium]|nr:DUF2520 domain-containing protein [Chloroflexota bacterium]MDA1218366.1 DUF2520 domain-containing protein [Chloroflexota bacterium]PKB57470.1 MAG: hypothetical protein BZY73_03045 [SAR202 cluster bacterium Casp-Chloro-G3]
MNDRHYRIGFVGIGVLGKGLALALAAHNYSVVAAHSRSISSAQWLADRLNGLQVYATAQDLSDVCDVVFITTPDSVITSVAESVNWRDGQAVVHCSGASSIEILECARAQGALTGGFHPFQTFAGLDSPEDIGSRLAGVTFAVAGADWLGRFLWDLGHQLGGQPVTIPDQHRPLYHASAVLSCGYLAALIQVAVDSWGAMGFTDQEALDALLPLATATLENIGQHGIPASVTGPVVRGDVSTISAHLEALSRAVPDAVTVYSALTSASLNLAAQHGVAEPQLEQIQKLIADYHRRCSPCPE